MIEFIEFPYSLNGFFKQTSISSIVIKSNNAQLNITDYGLMFQNCLKLKYVDLSNFNFSTAKILKHMFKGNQNLETIKFPNNLKFLLVEDYSRMFEGCSKLTSIDVSSFDTSNVNSMTDMFNGCAELNQLDISKFDMSKVLYINRMFERCPKLSQGGIIINKKSMNKFDRKIPEGINVIAVD